MLQHVTATGRMLQHNALCWSNSLKHKCTLPELDSDKTRRLHLTMHADQLTTLARSLAGMLHSHVVHMKAG